MGAPVVARLRPDTLHVYPTALKVGAVLREEVRAHGRLVGHHATTFPELVDVLARDLGVSARVLDPPLAAVVLERALARTSVPALLRERRGGLVTELLGVVGEFEAAHLAPAEVAELATALPRGPERDRLDALARVYAAYEAALDDLSAVDRHGRDRAVCERLAAAVARGERPRSLAGIRRIVFAELYDFSLLQFLIATSLITLIGDAELVVFAHPENVDATRFLDRTWNRFVADESVADQVLPSFVVRGGRRGSLAAALRGVFAAERPAPVAGDRSIRLIAAPGRYAEVEAACREIRRRLEAGAPPERLALLARDLSAYGDLIEDVCRRFRIPVYFRKGKPLLATPLVRACLGLVRCAAEGMPVARLEAVLASDYFGVGRPALVRLLREVGYVSAAGRPLLECLAHAEAALAARADDPTLGTEARAGLARRGRRLARGGPELGTITATIAALDARRTVRGHVRAVRLALRALRFRPCGGDDGSRAATRRDARAWALVEDTLEALAGVTSALGAEEVPLGEFVRLVLAATELQEIADPAAHAGSVRALSVLDARGLDFDCVYLLGLDDGTFPTPRREGALLPDGLKRVLNPVVATLLHRRLGARAAGVPLGGLLRTAREASLEDPFLFFLALSMAEREIVLLYPLADERGTPTVRSPFVDEVAACLLEGLEPEPLPPATVVPRAADCAEPAELVARAALGRWARPPAPPDRLAAALRAALTDGPERLAAIDRRAMVEDRRSRYLLTPPGDAGRKTALASAWTGRLAEPGSRLADAVRASTTSPTALEELGACGFRFFARRMLGLAEVVDPGLELDAREQGTLVHHVLEDFLRAHPVLPADVGAARATAREFLAREAERATGVIAAKDRAFWEIAWTRVAGALDAFVEREHAEQVRRTAEGIEVERRLEESFVLVLSDPAGGPALTLAGRPDRLDILRRDGRAVDLRVLDYKVARETRRYAQLIDPEKQLGVTGFQIPVYLLAALDRSIPGVDAQTTVAGGYVVLLAPGDPEVVRPFDRHLLGIEPGGPDAPPSIVARIHDLVRNAGAGHFDVDPRVCDAYCPYRAVCRYQQPPREESGGDD
ncbi:MAG: PD-(D/E)XK nuclease family protein [Candidatus Binatia bacterium]